MDKAKAVQIFLERVEQLTRLPFITNAEMESLYGKEVATALDGLARLEEKQGLCRQCQSRCCPAVKCELYAPQFDRCPIYDLRPATCRLHYCHRFFEKDDTLLKDLSDVFFDGLLAAESRGSDKVRLFDTPPLARCSPALVETSSPWVDAVRAGTLAPGEAMALIRRAAENHA